MPKGLITDLLFIPISLHIRAVVYWCR